MDDKRVCPLRLVAGNNNEINEQSMCIQEKCAWYPVEGTYDCSIEKIGSMLDSLNDLNEEVHALKKAGD